MINVVGAGSFGVVVACKDRSTGRKFALKIAPQAKHQAVASLTREKEMLHGVSHTNIVRVHEMHREYKNLTIMKMELGKESVSRFL